MQYIVVCSSDWERMAINELEKRVKKLCQEGWKPQGGISVAIKDNGWCFACQAMVK